MGPQRAKPFHRIKGGQEILQVPWQAGCLIVARHINRRAHLEADGPRHLFNPRFILRQNTRDDRATLRRGCGRPGFERGFGGGNGGIGIGLGPEADHRADFFC